MEEPSSVIESLFEKAEAYGKTTYELSKLKVLETITTVIASLISHLSTVIMIFFFMLLLSIGIALLLGDLLGKPYYGFFIVALLYFIAIVISHFLFHSWIKRIIEHLIVSQSLQQ